MFLPLSVNGPARRLGTFSFERLVSHVARWEDSSELEVRLWGERQSKNRVRHCVGTRHGERSAT